MQASKIKPRPYSTENSPAAKEPRPESSSPAGAAGFSFFSLPKLDFDNSNASYISPSTAVDDALFRPRPTQSNDGAVLQCPLTAAMYKDFGLLQKAHQNLLGFMRLIETRSKEIEIAQDPAHDFWGGHYGSSEKGGLGEAFLISIGCIKFGDCKSTWRKCPKIGGFNCYKPQSHRMRYGLEDDA